MIPEYAPILKAKKGELDALKHLKSSSLSKIRPILEIGTLSEDRIAAVKKFKNSATPFARYLIDQAEQLAELPDGFCYSLDIRDWSTNATVESGEHVLSFLYRRLDDLGLEIHPALNYEFWIDPEYQSAFKNLPFSRDSEVVIRLGAEALEDMEDIDYFLAEMSGIMMDIPVDISNISAVIDLSDITLASAIEVQERVDAALEALSYLPFKYVSMAGSSLPASVSEAVQTRNSTALLLRKEMNAWKALIRAHPTLNLVFGDYGVRNPQSLDGIKNPNTNGKIRYTIKEHHFVLRGHSVQEEDGWGQHHELARNLVDSTHFSDSAPSISWGDQQILECQGRSTRPGNSTTWIGYDTNHHIEAVLLEVFEFKNVTIPQT